MERAYELGRRAIESELGLLHIMRVHDDAVNTIVESTHTTDDRLRQLIAAQNFLSEALAPFEMTHRGYMALLHRSV